MQDLNTALELPRMPARVRELLLVQRGVLLHVGGEDERARADFEAAAAMGNAFAKQQAVRLNPFARLCNQMMAQALAGCQPNQQPNQQPSQQPAEQQ